MECEKLIAITKRWGYYTTHRYLTDVYGYSKKEVEECVRGVGIDLGFWSSLYASLPGEAGRSAAAVSSPQRLGSRTSNSPSFV
ncbi:MAG: hypothetical protein ACO2PM_12335 [Pyrobaculum sp.]|jgi:hypothetical protein